METGMPKEVCSAADSDWMAERKAQGGELRELRKGAKSGPGLQVFKLQALAFDMSQCHHGRARCRKRKDVIQKRKNTLFMNDALKRSA